MVCTDRWRKSKNSVRLAKKDGWFGEVCRQEDEEGSRSNVEASVTPLPVAKAAEAFVRE